jgi:NTP pyrophosphatase (non-canonical NTP hydrolase)
MGDRVAKKTIPPVAGRDIENLLAIMAALRTPGTGCPWDLEQTFETIAPYTIEEAYEVADAVERGDMGDLAEELGDLLLQVVFHAEMASSSGAIPTSSVPHEISPRTRSRRCGRRSRPPRRRSAGSAAQPPRKACSLRCRSPFPL